MRLTKTLRRAALLICLLASPQLASAERGRVIDGDTFDLGSERIRIHGIDAPEAGQLCLDARERSWACGDQATAYLRDLIAGQSLRCVPVERDRYGRLVAQCSAAGMDIGAEMVARGLAWAFVKYSDAYVVEEFKAREARLGIWQGAAQPAWGVREDAWDVASKLSPGGCPIKGNISGSGKIYHMPWSKSYAKTRINVAKGERWFCDEAEAIAAGWRAPRQR